MKASNIHAKNDCNLQRSIRLPLWKQRTSRFYSFHRRLAVARVDPDEWRSIWRKLGQQVSVIWYPERALTKPLIIQWANIYIHFPPLVCVCGTRTRPRGRARGAGSRQLSPLSHQTPTFFYILPLQSRRKKCSSKCHLGFWKSPTSRPGHPVASQTRNQLPIKQGVKSSNPTWSGRVEIKLDSFPQSDAQ